MESMPIFQGSMILNKIFCALYMLDEYMHYTKWQVFGLFSASIITIIGICVIMRKPSSLTDLDRHGLSATSDDYS